MRFLYLHQYFVTRSGVGGTRSFEFARHLRDKGHHVTVLTAPYAPTAKIIGARKREMAGVEVIEVYPGYANYVQATQKKYSRRIYNFLAFAFASTMVGLYLPKPEVVFATSTPLTIAIPGLIISKARRIPLVFEVRDLWPEAPIQIGALKSSLFIWLARCLERTVYRHSDEIIALSPGICDGIVASGEPRSKVTIIPNASDLDLFSPNVDGSDFRRKLGLHGRFACVYFGAMGEANGLGFVLDAAAELKRRQVNDIVFVLHGQGSERPMLESRCSSERLANVVFSDPISDKEAVAQLAAASDVCMTIYKNLPVLRTCSPNKLFDSLAAGKPILVNMSGWLQELVERNRVGVFVEPKNPADFADKVIYLRDHPELCTEYGKNARRLAEDQFARQKLAKQLEQILNKAIFGRWINTG